jgi:DNA-binding response OmpR family regulator
MGKGQAFKLVHEPQALRKLQILLVDADQSTCDRLQQSLASGCVVECAPSFSQAKLYLETQLPDVLIVEVLLAHENGLDLCRFIRRQPALRHLPIMLLTSQATLQDKIAGFEAGADDYVVKPFDARHLLARIRLLARIKRIEQSDNAY